MSDSNFRSGKEEWFRLQRPSRQRSSASDSNLRCIEEEWFRLQTAAMPELQRFLISGGQFGNRCKETLKNGPTAAVILDFRARLANRCKVLPGNAIFRALILDFRPRLGNRCMVLPENAIFRASILDFRPRIGNHCITLVAAVWNGPPASPSLRQRRTARLQHHR